MILTKNKSTFRKFWQQQLPISLLLALVIIVGQLGSYSIALAAAESTLTPGAKEAANLLGILLKVERLIQLEQSHRGQDITNDEELALKVDVFDKVLGGSLEVRMVSGQIDRQITWAFAGQSMLEAKRQRNLNLLFTANFMQGGILGILSGPAFLHNEPTTGTELLLLASSIGLGLSILALAESRSGHKKIDGGTTVLADVFKLPHAEQDHRADIVLKFLNSSPPMSTSNETRIQILIDSWKKGRYLRSTSEHHLQKLAALEPAVDKEKENIRLISNRIRMLFDTQYTVQELDTELLDLLRATDLN